MQNLINSTHPTRTMWNLRGISRIQFLKLINSRGEATWYQEENGKNSLSVKHNSFFSSDEASSETSKQQQNYTTRLDFHHPSLRLRSAIFVCENSRRSLWLDDYSLFTVNFIQTCFLLHSTLLTRSCHELFSLHNSLSIVMNHTGIICNTHHVKAASVLLLLSKKCCKKRRSKEEEIESIRSIGKWTEFCVCQHNTSIRAKNGFNRATINNTRSSDLWG